MADMVVTLNVPNGINVECKDDGSLVDDDTFGEYTLSDLILEESFQATSREKSTPDATTMLSNSVSSMLSLNSYNSSLSSFVYESSDDEENDAEIASREIELRKSESTSLLSDLICPCDRTIQAEEVSERCARVQFGEVTVREYPVTIGDSHTVMCPLELSWEYKEHNWSSLGSYLASESRRERQYTARFHSCPYLRQGRRVPLEERRQWIAYAQKMEVSDLRDLEIALILSRESHFTHSQSKKSGGSIENENSSTRNQLFASGSDLPPRKPLLKRGSSLE